MLIFKITLAISGDRFFPTAAIPFITNKYVPESFHDADGDLTHGAIFYMHPQLFGIQGDGVNYEEWFVDLLEKILKFSANMVLKTSTFLSMFIVRMTSAILKYLTWQCLKE